MAAAKDGSSEEEARQAQDREAESRQEDDGA
jgi:hypothetical protein